MQLAERELWQAVIFRACLDAFTTIPKLTWRTDKKGKRVSNKSHIAAMTRQRNDAREWLSGRSADFREVCSRAGMDADFVAEAWRDGKISLASLKKWDTE